MNRELSETSKLVELIQPIMYGHPAEIQGAVIAELLALWLAGSFMRDEAGGIHREHTDMLRETLAEHTLDAARELIPMFEEAILDARKGRK